MNLSFRSLVFFCLLPYISMGQAGNNKPQLFFEQPYALQRTDLKSVTCIFKDSRHVMWFGTTNGLYRYDGANLRYFGHHSGDLTSLPSNEVLGIVEDKNSQLWVSLITGIARIDLNTLRCETYSASNKRIDSRNFTNRICVDDSGKVWVGNNFGIFLLNKDKQLFTNVWNNKVPSDSLSQYVTSIVNINKHLLIASTFHDLILFNKDDNSFKRVPLFVPVPPKDSSITSIFLDSKQKLWVGTWGGGIYNFDLNKNKFSRVSGLQTVYSIPHFYITSFFEATLGKERIIIASSSIGIVKITINANGEPGEFTLINHDKNAEHSIIPGIITSSYFDSDGALWCAGENGVCRCFPFQDNFKFFATVNGLIIDLQPLKINSDNCYSIISWNTTSGLGFLLNDSIGKQVYQNIDPHFADKDDKRNMSGIVKDRYNRLWFSSMAGVSVVDDKFKVIKQWNKDTKGENSLTYYRTSGIAIHNDTVWVICYHRGIDLFDMSFKKLCHFSVASNNGLSDNFVYSFFNDSKGNLWICGNDKLYKYLPAANKFKPYKLSAEPNGCAPRDIAETRNGNLIIASLSGVIKFDPNSEKYSYLQSDLLEKEQSTSSAAVDKNGEIWFLTDKHLVHYKPNENRFILFGQEDGLDASRGLQEVRTFNGRDFYLCQDDQVVKFNCDSLSQQGTPAYLAVNMQVNDSDIYLGNNEGNLTLPHNKNKAQFEFTGVSYIKADQNQYYYQLSDIDKQWNSTYKNSVSYANLAPGVYTFRVKVVNYAGMWSEEKAVHFIITPPYWQTWWFRLLSAVVIVSILFFVIRYISQRNLKEKILKLEKETAIERERNRIAQDMHDDLGSGLTKIAILSEVVKTQIAQPEKASVQLDRISDSSRTLVDNLQDIIWMLNTKHDQLDSLAIYIREYATKYFEQSGITLSFEYPTNIERYKIREEQRRNLFMAIKEALNNIVKHSQARNVKITFRIIQNAINFVVSDDGKGFNTEETRQFANGVKNMQNRMTQAGGECNITSKPGDGTTITFSLCV